MHPSSAAGHRDCNHEIINKPSSTLQGSMSFYISRGRCQPFAHSLKKVLARE